MPHFIWITACSFYSSMYCLSWYFAVEWTRDFLFVGFSGLRYCAACIKFKYASFVTFVVGELMF